MVTVVAWRTYRSAQSGRLNAHGRIAAVDLFLPNREHT